MPQMSKGRDWERDNIPDDVAFNDYADPSFPWIRVIFGERPKLSGRDKYLYVLRANGKSAKIQSHRVAWYDASIPGAWPHRQRPIAYVVVDASFSPIERVKGTRP
jgi:hypothetical protein